MLLCAHIVYAVMLLVCIVYFPPLCLTLQWRVSATLKMKSTTPEVTPRNCNDVRLTRFYAVACSVAVAYLPGGASRRVTVIVIGSVGMWIRVYNVYARYVVYRCKLCCCENVPCVHTGVVNADCIGVVCSRE